MDADELTALLATCDPLSSLDAAALRRAAERAQVEDVLPGTVVLDAFTREVHEVVVVLTGEIELWNRSDASSPDEVVERGDIFGYVSMLTDRTIGPRAVARTAATLTRLPAGAVRDAFATPAGARFLADRLNAAAKREQASSAEEAIVRSPLVAQLRAATGLEELRDRARHLPTVLAELSAQGLTPSRVITFHSGVVDTIVRRTLELVLAAHADVGLDDFAWLALGSNGRREAVLSSDIDAAVVFRDGISSPATARYREIFTQVSTALAAAGLLSDAHGTTPANRLFARTAESWRTQATLWLATPAENNGAIMTSLLVDARPIAGAADLLAVPPIVADLRHHRLAMRLLLQEALAYRARSARTLLGRHENFDIKHHALLPIVNLARWAGLATGTRARGTLERIEAVAGSPILPEARARTLAEVFEVLQGIRLRYQLQQTDRGEQPSDVLRLDRLSPIDRSVLDRATREIAATQRRATNIAHYLPSNEWTGPAAS